MMQFDQVQEWVQIVEAEDGEQGAGATPPPFFLRPQAAESILPPLWDQQQRDRKSAALGVHQSWI